MIAKSVSSNGISYHLGKKNSVVDKFSFRSNAEISYGVYLRVINALFREALRGEGDELSLLGDF